MTLKTYWKRMEEFHETRCLFFQNRKFEEGIDLAFQLLHFSWRYQSWLTEEAHRQNCSSLYLFLLEALDRLDLWEEYLELWAILRETTLTVTYSGQSLSFHRKSIEPFILWRFEESGVLLVHFLFFTARRKALIERKLQAQMAGKALGNLLHHTGDQRTTSVVRKIGHLLGWIKKKSHSL